jgi:precorrin-6Y C5,15-methyltransferase (decarboxylating)
MSGGRITVVGVGGAPLPPLARERLASAALVAGGERHLAEHAPAGAPTVRLTGDLAPALERLAAEAGPAVVLASGDPGFFGIVRALAERVGRERLEVLPAPSSVSAAFARAGLPWDDALVVSAHGRAPAAAVNAALAHPKVAVLTAPAFGPAELARALGEADRHLLVAERLGATDERVVEGTPAAIAAGSFADPNVVLVLDPARAFVSARATVWPPRGPTRWALPEEEFAADAGLITKAEVRALALARLGPGVGDLVWDVGAGSGSVAIECARLGAFAVAIERDPAACERIRANAARHGVAVRVVEGEAPAALAELPDPDAVFVGGGGSDLAAVLATVLARAPRAVVVALATLERVAPATAALAGAGLAVDSVMLQAARLRPLGDATGLAAANPVFLVCGSRE